MRYAIILAGGRGTRFWPLSRQSEPKQFLKICSPRSLIEDTIYRIKPLVKKENIYLAVSRMHQQKIKECLKSFRLPQGNFLFEPKAKSTLAPIMVLAAIIYAKDKDAVIGVFPSDHFIKDAVKFRRLFLEGAQAAESGQIVTFGIPPTRPETGYGYIKSKAYKVEEFIEKPSLAKAKAFIKDKRYYWNSGIFIFQPQVMLAELKKFMPRVYKIIANNKNYLKVWPKLPSVSLDYAIMEKTDKAVVLPAKFGWTDLGSWQAVAKLSRKDKQGNVFKGNCLDIGSKDTFIWSDNRLVATLGLKNMIIVDTEDALLVCAKDRSQDVKKITEFLRFRKFKKYL